MRNWIIPAICFVLLSLFSSFAGRQISRHNAQIEYLRQGNYDLQQRMTELESQRDELEKTMVEYMKAIDRKINKEKGEGGVK